MRHRCDSRLGTKYDCDCVQYLIFVMATKMSISYLLFLVLSANWRVCNRDLAYMEENKRQLMAQAPETCASLLFVLTSCEFS